MLTHEMLNYEIEGEIFEDTNQQIRGVFMINGAFRVELLEALSENSPINNYLKKRNSHVSSMFYNTKSTKCD